VDIFVVESEDEEERFEDDDEADAAVLFLVVRGAGPITCCKLKC
jgi:hypothetical protein